VKLYDRRIRKNKPKDHDLIVQLTTQEAEQLVCFLGEIDAVTYEDEGYETEHKLLITLSKYLDNPPTEPNPGWFGSENRNAYEEALIMKDINSAFYSG
jgi:hypothetical protein